METLFPELNKTNTKMDMKRILVSFLLVASLVFFAATVSAEVAANGLDVEVNGIAVNPNTLTGNPAIVAGESIVVRVQFESNVSIQDVTVEVELETNKEEVQAETSFFDVETDHTYVKTLKLDVPFDLKDELSGFATLNVEVSGQGDKTEESYTLRVQRESYNADIKSISVPQTVDAGDVVPVDVVLKNLGYNDLDDLYITASIPALGIERTDFFGDLVALRCDDIANAVDNYGVDITRKCFEDDEDTLKGRLFLEVPFSAESGVYTLEVTVENDDTVSGRTAQVVIENDFSAGNFIVSGSELLIVNPTNNVVVYRLVPENTATTSVSVSENLVAVPAGSSKMVSTSASSNLGGTYTYTVNVFDSSGKLVDSVDFTKASQVSGAADPIVVLTVILAIIFVVLLVVLIVLIGKKPKTEDFGESYY